MTDFRPRPGQSEVLSYSRGLLGVAAAPGSGKTRTLALLAARLVSEELRDGQEVLVVTLVNSAVDNLRKRIRQATVTSARQVLPGLGCRVRTLHGLANDIVRERPGLVGLSEDYDIVDESVAEGIRRDAVDAWLRAHPHSAQLFVSSELSDRQLEQVRRTDWPNLVHDVVAAFIRRAKDLQLTPALIMEALSGMPRTMEGDGRENTLALARMAADVYAQYQHSIEYRGAVDFADLVGLAHRALTQDAAYRKRLQERWPFVLEDEAQDSSQIQEDILRLLASGHGNWVRVGDSNQAIYETFTTASPRFLRAFLDEPGVVRADLAQSGRSQVAIINLANHLVDWTLESHPEPSMRQGPSSAFLGLHITPTDRDDAQQNPPADPDAIALVERPYSPDEELEVVARSLGRWCHEQGNLPESARQSCAVLAPRTDHAARLADLLKKRGVPIVELLRTTASTRQATGALFSVLTCLVDPCSGRSLESAFKTWALGATAPSPSADEADKPLLDRVARRIGGCATVEAYLWPRIENDWLRVVQPEPSQDERAWLESFREVACRWHRAASLPIDQLILTLAGDLFREQADLALSHKLAVVMRGAADAHPGFRLPELVEELQSVAQNKRRFMGFTQEDTGFEPPRGVVTLATMHKAKGLEWDRVYLTSINNFDFPSGMAHDRYQDEKWYVRDGLSLQAEALAQLDTIKRWLSPGIAPASDRLAEHPEGWATAQARLDYVAERLRLLYVGITRARRELIVTWNTGRGPGASLQPAAALVELWHYHAQQKGPAGHG